MTEWNGKSKHKRLRRCNSYEFMKHHDLKVTLKALMDIGWSSDIRWSTGIASDLLREFTNDYNF